MRYIKNTHKKGPAGARNQGIEVAKGKYIVFLDSDDEWFENHLEESVKHLEKNKLKALHYYLKAIHYNFNLIQLNAIIKLFISCYYIFSKIFKERLIKKFKNNMITFYDKI